MLKMLFRGMLIASNAYYGDSIGLAPVCLSKSPFIKAGSKNDFWEEDCQDHPSRIACLNYES